MAWAKRYLEKRNEIWKRWVKVPSPNQCHLIVNFEIYLFLEKEASRWIKVFLPEYSTPWKSWMLLICIWKTFANWPYFYSYSLFKTSVNMRLKKQWLSFTLTFSWNKLFDSLWCFGLDWNYWHYDTKVSIRMLVKLSFFS